MSVKVIMLIGAPGSGKTTWRKHQVAVHGYSCISLDETRALIGKGEEDQEVSTSAFLIAYQKLARLLAMNKSVIIDATNMCPGTRKPFLKISKEHKAITMAVVFERSKEILLQRNKQRGEQGGRNVSEKVIDEMLKRYIPPKPDEFDEIEYISL